MSSRERRTHAYRYHAYRNPEQIAQDAVYGELDRYQGELLVIESIRVIVLRSHVIATVRCYSDDKSFEIAVYKPEQKLLTDAGYTMPTERGEHVFPQAVVTCKWGKWYHELGLKIVTVEPKEKTMETVQPESNEHAETVKAELGLPYATSDLVGFANAFNGKSEKPAHRPYIKRDEIIVTLTVLRDLLATDILGLTGQARVEATADMNAAHYIDNAIGSLKRAFPVPLISSDDVTERIPVVTDTGEAA